MSSNLCRRQRARIDISVLVCKGREGFEVRVRAGVAVAVHGCVDCELMSGEGGGLILDAGW